MKKLIILSLLIAAVTTMKSQADLPYKSLSTFNNDTIAYLVYNFETRAGAYKEKNVNDVLNDLRIPITFYIARFTFRQPKYYLRLFFNSNTDIASESNYYIYISSNTDYLKYVSWDGKWTEKIYESIKSIKVEGVGVSVPINSKYYKEKETKSSSSTPRVVPRDSPVIYKWDPDKHLK
ncbi:hypothetical protein [Dysgonomonas sp.]